MVILRIKAEQQQANVPLDVLEFIAQRAQQNIRELEGSLNRVIALAKLTGVSPTIDLATRAMIDIGSKSAKNITTTANLIIGVVAKSFQLSPGDLKSSKRDKETVLARHVAMYLIRQETDCSLAHIGKEIGGRDHSTVLHACEKIAHGLETNPQLKHQLLDLQHKINRK
jgi:chromosomal replication initiator protein